MFIYTLSSIIVFLSLVCMYLFLSRYGDIDYRKNTRDLKRLTKKESKILEKISSIEKRLENDIYLHDDVKDMLMERLSYLKNELSEIRFTIRLIVYDMKYL